MVIDYYSDVLCVWAWISQRRIEELESQWGEQIHLKHQCVDVFGDTASKIDAGWRDRGGYEGFAEHVQASAARFEHVTLHPDLWVRVQPATSANAHLVLKAVEITESHTGMVSFANRLRRAFFVEAMDIGQLSVVRDLATDFGLDAVALRSVLTSGRAMAALMTDYRHADQKGIHGSPTWVMNEGRQTLFGNVGYRVLNANVEELLRHPEQEASWCS